MARSNETCTASGIRPTAVPDTFKSQGMHLRNDREDVPFRSVARDFGRKPCVELKTSEDAGARAALVRRKVRAHRRAAMIRAIGGHGGPHDRSRTDQ
jgi:hypothetical protein